MAPIDNSRVAAPIGEFVRWWWNCAKYPAKEAGDFPCQYRPARNMGGINSHLYGSSDDALPRVGAKPVELCEIPRLRRGVSARLVLL